MIGIKFLNKTAIDFFVLANGDLKQLQPFGIAYIVLIILQAMVVYVFIRFTGKIEMQFAYDIRNQAFRKLQEQSFSYFDKTPQGWIMARLTSDIGRLADIVSWSIIDLVWGLTLILGVSIVMLVVNWKLALMVLVVEMLTTAGPSFSTSSVMSGRGMRAMARCMLLNSFSIRMARSTR